MTHSREFYLLDDEPSVSDWYPRGHHYPAYFPAEDRIGVVYFDGVCYPSILDPTPGYYTDAWAAHLLTRLDA